MTIHTCRWLPVLLSVFLLVRPGYAQTNGDIIIITGEDISRMQANTMADVLNQVAGITAGESSVGIHGSYKVKVFLDGRPINDPTSSHGGINWNLVNLEQVEEMRILQGKGSVRYGQGAAGGGHPDHHPTGFQPFRSSQDLWG